jgi:methylmalonyl-CoA decarboxylase
MSLVLTQLQDLIGTVTLNHPEKRNALSRALIADIVAGLAQFKSSRARAVILRATRGAEVWSAGHSIQELPQSHGDPLPWDDPLRRLIREVEGFPAPIIAMVEGSVWGGASEVVFACDIVVAAQTATFAITPARFGVPYNLTGLLTFMNAVNFHIVKEMAFTGQPIRAERAERVGLVNRVVPREELEQFTYEMASRIAQSAPLSVSVMKEEFNILASARDLSPLMFERIQTLRRAVYNSRDYAEGIRAFLEHRMPSFTGE